MQKSPSTFMTPLSSNISPTCGLVEVIIITMATIAIWWLWWWRHYDDDSKQQLWWLWWRWLIDAYKFSGECGSRTEPGIFYDGDDLAWRNGVIIIMEDHHHIHCHHHHHPLHLHHHDHHHRHHDHDGDMYKEIRQEGRDPSITDSSAPSS